MCVCMFVWMEVCLFVYLSEFQVNFEIFYSSSLMTKLFKTLYAKALQNKIKILLYTVCSIYAWVINPGRTV